MLNNNWQKFEVWLSNLNTDRVDLSPKLSAFVAERIAQYPGSAENTQYLDPYVEKFGILPMLTDWTDAIGILPDGAVRMFCTDSSWSGGYEGLRKLDEGQRKVDSGWNFLLAVLEGARKYPLLGSIVPALPDYMETCTVCLGSGRRLDEPVHLCDCRGLGLIIQREERVSLVHRMGKRWRNSWPW